MRAAQVADVWRGLFRRSFDVSYDRIDFKGVRRLGTAAIDFCPGVTAVVGGNGVGKSTLMSTIIRSLGPAHNSHAATLFNAANIEIRGKLTGIPDRAVVSTSIAGETVAVDPIEATIPKHHWIDPSTNAARVQKVILEDSDFSANLEGIDPEEYGDEDREALSYIVGKTYDHVEIFEIEYADIGNLPYFKVRAEGIEYDSAQMGLGELSLFLIYWELRAVELNSIVLIEEPETHVSPRSQECLINVCAKICLQKGLNLIITTHSPFIIWRLPPENLRLLIRDGENVGVISAPTHDQVARILGDRLNYHGVLLVEDELSRCVVRSILRALAPDLLEYYEVVNATSNDGIKQSIDRLPKLKNWFSMIGVFDGDQQAPMQGGDIYMASCISSGRCCA